MRFAKALLFTVLMLPVSAWASGDCADEYADCHDTCVVSYGGSIQESVKAKLVKCVARCQKTANNCRERVKETKVNQLDEPALDKKTTEKLNKKENDELTPESKPGPLKPKSKKIDDDDLRNQ